MEKINRCKNIHDASAVYLATWLVNDMSGLVLVLIFLATKFLITGCFP